MYHSWAYGARSFTAQRPPRINEYAEDKRKQQNNLFVCSGKSEAEVTITRGQSNLTKSASRGPIPRLGVTPGGRKLYH